MGFTLPPQDSPREQVRQLITRKETIESEIEAQLSILKSHACTMTTPLVDPDGFPRADIDVWTVRLVRVRIIQLRNDLKDLMNEIGKVLESVYDPALFQGGDMINGSAVVEGVGALDAEETPFARVDGIAPGSPAADAGLRREDLVVKFGHLTRASFSSPSLQPLADLVANSEDRDLQVRVMRSGDLVTLKFTPRSGWGGRGMLGCHIVPYTSS